MNQHGIQLMDGRSGSADQTFQLDNFQGILVFLDPVECRDGLAFVFDRRSSAGAMLKEFQKAIKGRFKDPARIIIKLVLAGGDGTEANWSQELKTALAVAGLTLQASVIRPGPIEGVVSFTQSRLRIGTVTPSSASNRIRVLIVDDSKTIRDLLTRVLTSDPGIEVVAQAEHPHRVEALIEKHKPDVITLDIHMPDQDGVSLLAQYLPKYPIPTIMISSITQEEGPQVFNALEIGAVDYIQKPSFSELPTHGPLIIEKVRAAAKASVKGRSTSREPVARIESSAIDSNTLIAIGSSTGGTEALKRILTALPERIPPIVIVQHIPPVFSKAFADRLNQICRFEVKEAQDGDVVSQDRVLVAPGGFQMELQRRGAEIRVSISDAPPVNRHKPSVDHLFASIAKLSKDKRIIAAILTGMGADGARGLLALREASASTLAQDEKSCVVFGMPKEAIRMGGAEKVVSLEKIATQLMEWSLPQVRSRKRA